MARLPVVLALSGVNASGEGLRSEDDIFQGDTTRPGGDVKKDIFVPFDPFDLFEPFFANETIGVVAMFFF